jgi:hypothetical protein
MMFRSLTLQEANTLLPFVKERFARMQRSIAEGQNLSEALLAVKKNLQDKPSNKQGSEEVGISNAPGGQLAETTPTLKTKSKTNASMQREVERKKKRLKTIEAQLRREILQLQHCGVHVKSVFPARADFLGERHRQPVFLCWCMGERSIEHWHPLDENFSTRQPITDPTAFGPVVIH